MRPSRPAALRPLAAALALAALLSAGGGAAMVPPVNWKPTKWAGPGKLCAEGFDLELLAGETATGGFPSEGSIPYTIDSPRGRFTLVEVWFNFRPHRIVSTVWTRPEGALSRTELEGAAADYTEAQYLFMPSKQGAIQVEVIFSKDVPRFNLKAWPADDYASVLGRIAFAPGEAVDCLSPLPSGS